MVAAYKNNTWVNHRNNLKKYSKFCVINKSQESTLSVHKLSQFIIFLIKTTATSQAIFNVLSSLKLYAQLVHINLSIFSNVKITLLLKNVKLHVPKCLKPRVLLTPANFLAICNQVNVNFMQISALLCV